MVKILQVFVSFLFIFINLHVAQAFDCNNTSPDWIFCDDFEREKLSDKGWYYNPGSTYFPTISLTQPGADITTHAAHSGTRSMRCYLIAGDAGEAARGYISLSGQ